MKISRSASGVRVQTPAKINLFFEVLRKRSDGFHEIETLMAPVGLFDDLHFTANSSSVVTLDCRWAEASVRAKHATLGPLPAPQENLAYRAITLLKARAGIQLGATVQLIKRIPAAAGLGGGSSDAAAALVAANLGWQLGWSVDQLSAIAAELGSDVPFFLAACPALCRGRGELIEKVNHLGIWHAVIVQPPVGLATNRVYGHCIPAENPQSPTRLVKTMRRGDLRAIGPLLCNRLQPAAEKLSPWIDQLRQEFERTGCRAAQMSGSGSSYFGICHSARHAKQVAARLSARNVGRVFVVQFGDIGKQMVGTTTS